MLVARTGAEALAILHSDSSISLLLTDIVMPGDVNGRQLAEQTSRFFPNIKILFTSGYANDRYVDFAKFPASRFLLKPYTQFKLQQEIEFLMALPTSNAVIEAV